jgi:murein DD-endopeptidase MepM/ murein hydrolase activator NlpD
MSIEARWLVWLIVALASLPARAAVQGGIEVIPLPEGTERATYRGRNVLVLAGSPPRAVVGIPLSARAGRHEIVLTHGARPMTRIPFTVTSKKYPEQRLTIKDPKMVNPDPKDLVRIERETKQMLAQYERFSPLHASPFPLLRPADGAISSQFGFRRILNGEPRNPHTGMDIAADTGTPILSPAAGTISLIGNFYFNGNTVFVDHGAGLISMFCHLSAVDVKEGETVDRGKAVGKVGATGRATGPHLHWSLSMNGERIDPSAVLTAFRAP